MRPERVIIAGGGIGGMALAAALQRLGVRFLVLERAAELGEVGAGLGVLPNAVRALVAIGVGTELFRDGGPFRRFRICNQAGEELKEVDFESFFRRLGGEGYVLHRAALHAALAKRVDSDAIRTGASVAAVEQSETEVRVHLEGDSTPVVGDLLVGADGLNSVVREYVLADGPPRYAGETIFRGIVEATLLCASVVRILFALLPLDRSSLISLRVAARRSQPARPPESDARGNFVSHLSSARFPRHR